MEKNELSNKIAQLVKEYFSKSDYKFIPGETKIPLSIPAFGHEEAIEAIESILTTWVTMGKKVAQFEEIFADYIGSRHGIMVNSGSSANLLALSVLSNPTLKNHIKTGEEIITPAVTWATTIFPIANVNALPVIVDVDLETYNINLESMEKAITNKTKAIMPVHLLGNPCDMKVIREIADKHDLFVIEDSCEAHGAELDGKKTGSFGDISTFSFFLSHHITTIEGGMVLTDNEDYSEIAKSTRAFGWIRDLKNKDKIADENKLLDKRFLFLHLGFNIRPTEIQGAFGIHQMKKLENFISIRRENSKYWNNRLEQYSDMFIIPTERKSTRHVWFGYPLTVKENAPFKKEELVKFLEAKKIETRPIMTGNILDHPVSRQQLKYRVFGDLKNSKTISKNSFFFGNHHGIREEEREYVADAIDEFMKGRL